MCGREAKVGLSGAQRPHLVMLLEHPLHKLVAAVVELCAASRGHTEPAGAGMGVGLCTPPCAPQGTSSEHRPSRQAESPPARERRPDGPQHRVQEPQAPSDTDGRRALSPNTTHGGQR